jgi:ATP-binding protein involved in chromosome partitioning
MSQIQEDAVWSALRKVHAPEMQRDVVSLNVVQKVEVDDAGHVTVSGALPPPLAPHRATIEREIKGAIIMLPGAKRVTVEFAGAAPAQQPHSHGGPQGMQMPQGIRNIIGVASGKGGVGKSTVSVNLAAALAQTGARVGLLDADIYGPNVPLMSGLSGAEPTVAVHKQPDGSDLQMIEPLQKHGLKVMSMGFLLHEDQPVVWRGPMLNSALRQFFGQVDWGELDYLIVDLPPGTGDVQISLMQLVQVTGIVHVTTPQDVALQDVRRGIAMFQAQNVRLLGIIENMSYFECPHCHERTDVFSHGGGRRVAECRGIPFLGEIPLDIKVREAGDSGMPIVVSEPQSPHSQRFVQAAKLLVDVLGAEG